MIEKRKPYRNKKLLEAARGQECTMNSPHCNYDSSTSVFCHINASWAGKGIGQKADDCAGFIGCSGCHSAYDSNRLGGLEDWYVLRAYYRTIRLLLDRGIFK